jgi:Uma2 family endonuclease
MQETMLQPPRTIMEVFKMLPQGTLAEVIENTLYMSPTPTSKHQRLVRELLGQIDRYVKQEKIGEVFVSPLDVFLDETSNAVQPDVFFIESSKLSIVDPNGHVHGVPDLIIEILSPGNSRHDKTVKKQLYEKFGVKEYWIIDPDSKTTTGYSFTNNKLIEIGEFEGELKSILLKQSFIF